jgi:hypothetical protein
MGAGGETRGLATASVSSSKFASYISDAYNLSTVDEDSVVYVFNKDTIESAIMNDTFGRLLDFRGARFESMTLKNAVPPLAVEPDVDITIVDTDHFQGTYLLPSSHMPFSRDISLVRFPNDILRFGHLKTSLSTSMLMSLTRNVYEIIADVYASYATAQIGVTSEDVQFEPKYDNLSFYKRDTKFNEYFVEYKLHEGVTRFIFNPYTYSVLKDKITPNVLDSLNRASVYVQYSVLAQLREYVRLRVSYWYRTYHRKNVMHTIKKFLEGAITLKDIHDIEVNQALTSVMRHMTDAISEKLGSDDTLLTLVVLSEYISGLTDMGMRQSITRFEAEHFEV